MNLQSKVVFCCSFFVMILLLKTTVFENQNIFSISSMTINLQNELNETSTKDKSLINNNISLILESQKPSNQSNSFDKPGTETTGNKPETAGNTSIKGFPYEENCFFNSYPKFKLPKEDEQDFDFLKSKDGRNYKTILAYHYAYGNNFGFGFGRKLFEEACCKEKRCFITNIRNKISVDEFDAVIIHFRDFNYKNLPKKRKKHQRWIFYEREPPTLSSKNPQKYEGVFNWTMTYRRDSDILSGYGQVYQKSLFGNKDFSTFDRKSPTLEKSLKSKKKLVAWMVSHCNVQSKRDEFTKQLQKYIQVDIYGNCGTLKCDRKNNLKCYEMIEKNYKFYLSFENSFCTDYITEKLYNPLRYNIIPVVRGSGDYASMAPPHSYINAGDFKTVKELAAYLKYLDKNNTAYLEYFKWRQDYLTISMNWINHAGSFCDLCYKLHNDPKEKIYYNLKEWFQGKSKCI